MAPILIYCSLVFGIICTLLLGTDGLKTPISASFGSSSVSLRRFRLQMSLPNGEPTEYLTNNIPVRRTVLMSKVGKYVASLSVLAVLSPFAFVGRGLAAVGEGKGCRKVWN